MEATSLAEAQVEVEKTHSCPFVLVTGMHRSGTSMVAGMLDAMGVFMGPPSTFMRPLPENPKGFYENRALMGFNREILASMDPEELLNDRKLMSGWIDLIRQTIRNYYPNDKTSGFKDPRMCLTLPLWVSALQFGHDKPVKVIKMHRLVDEIAVSLHERNGMDMDLGRAIAQKYDETFDKLAIRLFGHIEVLRITFTETHHDPLATAVKLATFINPPDLVMDCTMAADFVEKSLHRSKSPVLLDGEWWKVVN